MWLGLPISQFTIELIKAGLTYIHFIVILFMNYFFISLLLLTTFTWLPQLFVF